jgi:CheY-like chemotaxis protein
VLYKRVLLLEDNKMNQRVATELLESAGVSSRWPTMVGW